MACHTNMELRDLVKNRRLELEVKNPLLPLAKLNHMIADELEISEFTVRYYLRTCNATDARLRYTDQERQELCRMTRKQLEAYAAKHNRNFNSLYAMAWRYKSKAVDDATKLKQHFASCVDQGFMDFSRAFDLKAYQLPKSAFKDARKAISAVKGLDLMAPNYLISRTAHKFYPLTLQEQHFLLTNPRRFLKENGARIAQSWRSCDPSGHYFVLLEAGTENRQYKGKVVSTHDTLDLAAQQSKRLLHAATPKVTKIIRCFGESKSVDLRYQPGEWIRQDSPDNAGVVVQEEIYAGEDEDEAGEPTTQTLYHIQDTM